MKIEWNTGFRLIIRRRGLGTKAATWIPGLRYIFYFWKFPEKTEAAYFIDIRVIYRSARNDDCRDDSLKWPMLKQIPAAHFHDT